MDTDALRWFQQVADGVTVTEVSELDQVTQSGVSRALARLEREVGSPLLRRSGRILRMTRAGEAFKHHVDSMLHELADGLAAVNQLIDPETGTVGLAFHLSLGTWLVPDLVSSFRSEHPKVRFELKQVHDEMLPSMLARGEVDLEISTVRATDPTVTWRRVLLEPLRLAVPSGHPLEKRSKISLREVAAEPFIMLRSTTLLRRLAEELTAGAGFAPTVAFEGDDLPTVHGFVAAGLGVAIVPLSRFQGAALRDTGVNLLEITDPGAVREIGLAWSADRRLLPSARLFRDHVIARADSAEPPAGRR